MEHVIYDHVFGHLSHYNILNIACVASVSVRFRNKERGTRVKDHAINNSLNFSRDQNRKSPSSFYSETKRKRLLRRPHSEGLISRLLLRGEGRGFPRLLRTWSLATFKVNRRKIEPKETLAV